MQNIRDKHSKEYKARMQAICTLAAGLASNCDTSMSIDRDMVVKHAIEMYEAIDEKLDEAMDKEQQID